MSGAKILDSLVEWLQERDWEVYAHLTFRFAPSRAGAWRCFKHYFKAVCSLYPEAYTFVAQEIQPQRGVAHYHCLIGGTDGMWLKFWWEFWWVYYGRALLELYDPELGALGYVGKYLFKEARGTGEWDILGMIDKPKLQARYRGESPRRERKLNREAQGLDHLAEAEHQVRAWLVEENLRRNMGLAARHVPDHVEVAYQLTRGKVGFPRKHGRRHYVPGQSEGAGAR